MDNDKNSSQNIRTLLETFAELNQKLEASRVERCVAFIDLAGYTEFVDQYGDFAGRLRVQTAGKTVVPCVEDQDGKVIKEIGDAWLVMFKNPNQAASAAIRIQREIKSSAGEEKDPIRLKVGIHFGRLLIDEEDIFGDVVNVSSRLMSNCQGGHILVSEDAYRSLDPYYRSRCVSIKGLELRGKSTPALAYELNWTEIEPSRSEKNSENPEDMLLLEVQWGKHEAKVSLRKSQEKNMTLISYEKQTLQTESIEALSSLVLKTIRHANVEGGTPDRIRDLKRFGKELFERLLPTDIRRQIVDSKSRSLLLSLDDSCVHLPWELLFDGEEFLCCRFAVGRIVRTRQSVNIRPKPTPIESFSLLVVSNPSGDLPAAQEEGKSLVRFLQSDIDRVRVSLFNGRVTKETIWNALPDADVFHYCGHSDFDHDTPDKSGWILSDGRLTAGDLQDLIKEQKSMPLLVFNNSCNSGTTKSWDSPDEGWSYGLANAFLMVGCSFYIGAISDLVDSSSKTFPILFYDHLKAGRSVGESLRLARVSHREDQGATDLTWAQFVFYGNPAGTILSPLEIPESAEELPAPMPASGSPPSPPPHTMPHSFNWRVFFSFFTILSLAAIITILLWNDKTASPQEIMGLIDQGVSLRREGQIVEAIGFFEKARYSDPENAFISSLISDCQELLENRENEKHWEEIRGSIQRIQQFAANGTVVSEKRDRWTSRPNGIAILDLELMGDFPNKYAEVEELRYRLGQELTESDRWLLVQQDDLGEILKQLEIDSSGLTKSEYASAIGQFFGASGLLGGSVQFRDGVKTVFLTVTETETRLIAASASQSSTREIASSANTLASNLLDQLNRKFPLRGRVSPTRGGVILNIGSDHGVQIGQQFSVRIKEPDEKSVLRTVGLPVISEIEVVEVDEENSFCVVDENLEIIEEGMRAERIPKEKDKS